MTSFKKLQRLLTELPGIGPRQAGRFSSFLVQKDAKYIKELTESLTESREHSKVCPETFIRFYSSDKKQTLSPIALDPNRDDKTILVVEKDVDVERIEQSKIYNGKYFVVGGTAPITESQPEDFIRLKELISVINTKSKTGLNEIILGLSANPEGEYTAGVLRKEIEPFGKKHGFKISTLGRGLSTGTELEYSDEDTIKNALENRT